MMDMMDKDTGGPAFPMIGEDAKGMTLRDYHIAHAPEVPIGLRISGNKKRLSSLEIVVTWRSNYADAVIAEGKK